MIKSEKLIEQQNYLNGMKHGIFIEYNSNGQSKIYNYKYNKLDGEYLTFFENGKKKTEYFYKNGKKKWNGLIKYEGNYIENQYSGEHKEYSENGSLIDTYFYEIKKNNVNFIDSNNNIDIKDKIYKNGIYKDGLKKTEYVNGIKHGKEIILMV